MGVSESYIKTAAQERAVSLGCYVDPRDADRVKRFAETFCRLADGDRFGQPVEFLPWVWEDIIFPLYSWRKPDGTRLYRRGSVWTPRKQTKTTTLACLSLYQLLEEPGAQVYVVSSSIECASQLYTMAANMVDQDKYLSKRLWVRPNIRVIEDKRQKSVLKVLSGDKKGKSGQGASCVFWDELAEIKDDESWHRLYNSGMARKQPVWLSISTPQYDRHGLAWAQYTKARNIIEGRDTDPEYLAVIKGVPESVPLTTGDGALNEEIFDHIPAIGQTCTKDYIRSDWEAVQGNPREIARFKNHVLGQWTSNAAEWLSPARYDDCTQDFEESILHGKRCYVGVDMGITNLGAYVLFFPDTGHVLCRYFIPEVTANKSDEKLGTFYSTPEWAPYVTVTPGDLFDAETMIKSLEADSKLFRFIEVGFDPYPAESRGQDLLDRLPCNVVPIQPTVTQMADPVRHLERLVHSKNIIFPACPVTRWNFLNAAVKEMNGDRIVLCREKSSGRYDSVAACVLAIHRHLADVDCVYNNRGILTF